MRQKKVWRSSDLLHCYDVGRKMGASPRMPLSELRQRRAALSLGEVWESPYPRQPFVRRMAAAHLQGGRAGHAVT